MKLWSVCVAAGLLLGVPLGAQVAAHAPNSASELRTARAFDKAKAGGPLELNAFLREMPKGGELHMHLSGAVYAETYIKEAAEELLCVNPATLSLTKNVGTTRRMPPQAVCAEGSVSAASVLKDQKLYDELVDGFSMKSYTPSEGWSGHDQFFATFGRFGTLAATHKGEWLDEVATRAASQNEQYLEILDTPSFQASVKLGYELGWPGQLKPVTTAETSAGDDLTGTSREELAALREKLLAGGVRAEAEEDSREFTGELVERERLEGCGTAAAKPACAVKIRFLYQVLRAFPPQQVFAHTLLAFEVASHDPNVVGINFVQPEDAYMAMSEYHRQMLMLDYLHSVYPQVHISLHAGELAPGMVPPAGLRFHIRQAVELGHADRIGHGVDVMYEDDPKALLKEMAAKKVAVEINLTSNDVILGVTANRHSLPAYRAAGVPVALSTDDEGVSRIDLTHEYVRAATEFGLGYLDLKKMARSALEFSFLPGGGLWAEKGVYGKVATACTGQVLGAATPNAGCRAFLKENLRATEEWELEHRFAAFEAGK
ncbi:adenosine deaminase [Granulicella sp. WH15]|uniref:adenosine deaminase family protein n=1 Tax=Granulicella sp. WH15 TaxID=2602070 RepID=UPI001366F976|nr:adenosine deaminase [Granulicella sp. WH15]QHN02423.1 adenosine deaminase [Granulicella sp. WH15]